MSFPKGYIKIQNSGEIGMDAILLLGASSKRGDESKIGFFGSGLKYAIAVLLRNKIQFHIFSGEKEIKITSKAKDFRGQTFNVIKVNGKETSLTVEMGPKWEAWFAVREIYCNALDEGDSKMEAAGEPKGEIGKTNIFIANHDSLKELFQNWDEYFTDKRGDMITDDGKGTRVYPRIHNKFIVYRRGVQCFVADTKSLYHYDLDWIQINESRVIESDWDLRYQMAQRWGKLATVGMINNLFDHYKDTAEIDFHWQYAGGFNENWLTAIADRKIIIDVVSGYFSEDMAKENCLVLPQDLANALHGYFGDKITVLGLSDRFQSGFQMDMNEKQKALIDDSLAFLRKADIDITYPIIIWKFKDGKALAEARDGKIRLAPRLFEMGKRMLVHALLEETAHLESGANDGEREFQNFLFNKVISLLEEKAGERL